MSEERARIYNVYLRPWVLDARDASQAVPHITALHVISAGHLRARTGGGEAVQGIPSLTRLRAKTTTALSLSGKPTAAWKVYIRGHIVSSHARRLISQFMAACCGKSKTEGHSFGEAPEDPTAAQRDATCAVSLAAVHHVLRTAENPGGTKHEEDPDTA